MIGPIGVGVVGAALIGLAAGGRPTSVAPKPFIGDPASTARPAGLRGTGGLASFDTFRALLEAGDDDKDAQGLTEEERKEVADLKERDREVRRHEQAHANAGGQFSGSPSYTLERGPDGRSYAVGGTTPIDVSPVAGDPEATVRKMQVVKRAALAPADPSPQDRRIAAQAESQRLKAQGEAARSDEDDATQSGRPDPLRPNISLDDFLEARRADQPAQSSDAPALARAPAFGVGASGTAPGTGLFRDNLVSLLA
jgi:hypothetical protein